MSEEFEDDLPLSRTKRKQLAKEVERIAERLVAMPDKALAQLKLPVEIAAEVEEARATQGRSSHKRQIKHLAGMLRRQEDDLLELMPQLESLDQVTRGEKQEFHRLERLRERLCDAQSFDAAFSEMLELYPQVDRNTIARLARSVHQHGDRRAYREIFKRLRDQEEN